MILLAFVAEAAEYRRVELADGRVLRVEVRQTTAEGLELQLPAGRLRVGFEEVVSIGDLSAADYAAQPRWRVLLRPVADPAVHQQLLRELGSMGGVQVVEAPPAAESGRYDACGADVACLQQALLPAVADVALVVSTSPNTLTVASVWTGLSEFQPRSAVPMPTDPTSLSLAVSHAVHEGLGLIPPPAPLAVPLPAPEPPPVAASPPPEVVPTPPRARAPTSPLLALVPVPGFPAWAAGQPGRGAAAAAVALPLTAGLVYVVGAESPNAGTFWGLSAAGYYVACVATSRAFFPVVTPTEGGGQVTVAGSF